LGSRTKSPILIIFLAGVLLLQTATFGNISTVNAESNEIPDWIKFNAEWWAEGLIDDSTFIDGIEYLIENGIIKSSKLTVLDVVDSESTTETSLPSIPQWVKNNARWWASNQISDETFLMAIENLVVNEIIQSPKIKVEKEMMETLDEVQVVTPILTKVEEDSPEYVVIEIPEFFEDSDAGDSPLPILVGHYKPTGKVCDSSESFQIPRGSSFPASFSLPRITLSPGDSCDLIYPTRASHLADSDYLHFFAVATGSISSWVEPQAFDHPKVTYDQQEEFYTIHVPEDQEPGDHTLTWNVECEGMPGHTECFGIDLYIPVSIISETSDTLNIISTDVKCHPGADYADAIWYLEDGNGRQIAEGTTVVFNYDFYDPEVLGNLLDWTEQVNSEGNVIIPHVEYYGGNAVFKFTIYSVEGYNTIKNNNLVTVHESDYKELCSEEPESVSGSCNSQIIESENGFCAINPKVTKNHPSSDSFVSYEWTLVNPNDNNAPLPEGFRVSIAYGYGDHGIDRWDTGTGEGGKVIVGLDRNRYGEYSFSAAISHGYDGAEYLGDGDLLVTPPKYNIIVEPGSGKKILTENGGYLNQWKFVYSEFDNFPVLEGTKVCFNYTYENEHTRYRCTNIQPNGFIEPGDNFNTYGEPTTSIKFSNLDQYGWVVYTGSHEFFIGN